ncbi:hypothetical protein M758_UG092000 [Ceratodon purpureus]|nr:hypothetical protein M758_UG092000 [Ceratodon purpureus]
MFREGTVMQYYDAKYLAMLVDGRAWSEIRGNCSLLPSGLKCVPICTYFILIHLGQLSVCDLRFVQRMYEKKDGFSVCLSSVWRQMRLN